MRATVRLGEVCGTAVLDCNVKRGKQILQCVSRANVSE